MSFPRQRFVQLGKFMVTKVQPVTDSWKDAKISLGGLVAGSWMLKRAMGE